MSIFEGSIKHHISKAVLMYNKGFVRTASSHKKIAIKLATELGNKILVKKVLNKLKVID
jgi:hypothetical protein